MTSNENGGAICSGHGPYRERMVEMNKPKRSSVKLPIVEIFQSLEGEGTKAGFVTTFIRLFGCDLKCSWCDTKYSYEPAQPREYLKIIEIIARIKEYQNCHICLTGGEPLLHGENSIELIQALARLEAVVDLHVETNGAVDLGPFVKLRKQDFWVNRKLRFIMDYKLPSSGVTDRMVVGNFDLLLGQDEIKLVIADERDFFAALEVLQKWHFRGQLLFSPVWGRMSPQRLATLLVERKMQNVKLNLPLHKIIWGDRTGV
jgi:7-carboxy-7-deazaguanine synthase